MASYNAFNHKIKKLKQLRNNTLFFLQNNYVYIVYFTETLTITNQQQPKI